MLYMRPIYLHPSSVTVLTGFHNTIFFESLKMNMISSTMLQLIKNKNISPLIMWTGVIITYFSIWCHEIKCCNVKSEFSCLCKLPNTCSNTYQVFSGYICGFSHDFFTENKNKLQLWVNNLETLGVVRGFWHPCFWRTGI